MTFLKSKFVFANTIFFSSNKKNLERIEAKNDGYD